MLKITLFNRHKIIILHQQGHSQTEISRQTGFSRCGIQGVEKFEISGHVEDKKRRGRPKKLSVPDEQFLKVTSLSDRKKSSKDLAQHLADSYGSEVDSSTVRRSLIKNGPNGRVAATKPFIRKGNGERGQNMQELKDWNEDQWKPCFEAMNQNSNFLGPVVDNT